MGEEKDISVGVKGLLPESNYESGIKILDTTLIRAVNNVNNIFATFGNAVLKTVGIVEDKAVDALDYVGSKAGLGKRGDLRDDPQMRALLNAYFLGNYMKIQNAKNWIYSKTDGISIWNRLRNFFKKKPKGQSELHHLASDKSIVSGFTAQYEDIFSKAGMTLDDSENIMKLFNHKGAHTNKYKQHVVDYLKSATEGTSGVTYRKALVRALRDLKRKLKKNPRMPYKGGL
jgi:hypothetical protein